MTISAFRSAALLVVSALCFLLAGPTVAQSPDEAADAAADSRAKTYNSSRSNKTDGAAAPAGAEDCDDADPCVHPGGVMPASGPADVSAGNRGVAAQDYNSSRSNKARGERVDTGGDQGADSDETPRAKTYNSTRSNRTGGLAGPAVDEPCEACEPALRERRVVAPKP